MDPTEPYDSTPTKSKGNFMYDYESPTSRLGFGSDGPMTSPGTVEWDFDVPRAPQKIINQAIQLSREATTERFNRKRNSKRISPLTSYQHKRKKIIDNPSNKNTLRSVNLLKEALDKIAPKIEDNALQSSAIVEQNTGTPGGSMSNSDLFDDSFNDCFNEFSQTVEDNFFNKKNQTNRSVSSDCSNNNERLISNVVDELSQVDDDYLFLDIEC